MLRISADIPAYPGFDCGDEEEAEQGFCPLLRICIEYLLRAVSVGR